MSGPPPRGDNEYLVDTENNRVIYPYTKASNIIGLEDVLPDDKPSEVIPPDLLANIIELRQKITELQTQIETLQSFDNKPSTTLISHLSTTDYHFTDGWNTLKNLPNKLSIGLWLLQGHLISRSGLASTGGRFLCFTTGFPSSNIDVYMKKANILAATPIYSDGPTWIEAAVTALVKSNGSTQVPQLCLWSAGAGTVPVDIQITGYKLASGTISELYKTGEW